LVKDAGLIAGMVSSYQPDYLLVELGFNDIGWFVSDAQGTLNSLINFITAARSAKADLKFVVANIPQRLFIGGRDDLITKTDEYNAGLGAVIAGLFTSTSPIYVAQFRENYSCKYPTRCVYFFVIFKLTRCRRTRRLPRRK
jgi:lysophospholipase L1-like esterase